MVPCSWRRGCILACRVVHGCLWLCRRPLVVVEETREGSEGGGSCVCPVMSNVVWFEGCRVRWVLQGRYAYKRLSITISAE